MNTHILIKPLFYSVILLICLVYLAHENSGFTWSKESTFAPLLSKMSDVTKANDSVFCSVFCLSIVKDVIRKDDKLLSFWLSECWHNRNHNPESSCLKGISAYSQQVLGFGLAWSQRVIFNPWRGIWSQTDSTFSTRCRLSFCLTFLSRFDVVTRMQTSANWQSSDALWLADIIVPSGNEKIWSLTWQQLCFLRCRWKCSRLKKVPPVFKVSKQ